MHVCALILYGVFGTKGTGPHATGPSQKTGTRPSRVTRSDDQPRLVGSATMDGGSEGFPNALVPAVFLQHAFGMKLEADEEACFGIVIGLDQSVFRMGHRAKAG